MAVVLAFVSVSYGTEHILKTIEVASYSNLLETTIPKDIDIRYVSEGEMKGPWLDLQLNTRVVLTLSEDLPDSIITFINIYQKWRAQAIEKKATVTKDIGTYKSACMYIPSYGDAGMGYATINVRFLSVEEGPIISTLMALIVNLETLTGNSATISPNNLIISDEKTEKLRAAMQGIDGLIKEANAKDDVAKDFTR